MIARLALRNLPIGIWKCDFLTTCLVVVGATISRGEQQLAAKSIKKLFASKLPRILAELQGLLGSLNFCSHFIPDYRRRVKPLLQLLHAKNDGQWLPEHTSTLNSLAAAVGQRIKLGIIDMNKAAYLHVDVDDTDLSGVLVQGKHNDYKVVSMIGRELLLTERKCSIIERLAIAAAWCVKKLGRYTNYLASGPGLTIVYPHAAEVACLSLADLPVRL